MHRISACVRITPGVRVLVITVSSTFPPVRMSTNSSGVCSAKHKKSAAVQLLHGQSRNYKCKIVVWKCYWNWKVKAGRDTSFTCLGAFSILYICTDGRIVWKVYPLYPFSETESYQSNSVIPFQSIRFWKGLGNCSF